MSTSQNTVVPTTTLAEQQANNTSAANTFSFQNNGNIGAGNVSRVDVHTLLYPGASTKVFAHLMLWFGGSDHMNVGYSSTDPDQVHRQISDMVSRGIDGVILDWYGPNNSIDQAAKLVMTEAESHPGFTFAIMVDQGAIKWDSCPGCSPQQALISQLQYVEQTYFTSKAYLTVDGKPVVTNFNIDLAYSVDWNAVAQALSSSPVFLFQNNDGFTHVRSDGSYAWVMPTTSDYGTGYLNSFYAVGMPLQNEQTVGAAYKGFNDTMASWGSNRIMGQQCGQTWLQTFSDINTLYDSTKQLYAVQLVTWNDYEEATEIESGIDSCVSISASVSGNSLQWTVNGDQSTIDHFVAYISSDGQNLMSLGELAPGTNTLNLCDFSFSNGSYTLYAQAVGKPSLTNRISSGVAANLSCESGSGSGTGSGSGSGSGSTTTFSLGANPSSVTIVSGSAASLTVNVSPQSGAFNDPVALSCSGLPAGLKCSFSPSSVIPGGGAASSVLTVTASSNSSAADYNQRRTLFLSNWLFGFGVFGLFAASKLDRRDIIRAFGALAASAVVLGTLSCGGAVPVSVSGSASKSYTVSVDGNSGGQHLSTSVTVTVR